MNFNLLYYLLKKEIHSLFVGSSLGLLWLVARPLLIALLFWLVFSKIMGVRPVVGNVAGNGELPYIVFLISTIFFWFGFQEGVSRATTSLLERSELIKKVPMPLLMLPTVSVLASYCQHLVGAAVSLLVISIFLPPTALWIMILPVMGLQIVFTVGLGYGLSALSVYLRDIPQVVALLLQGLFFPHPHPLSPRVGPGGSQSAFFLQPAHLVHFGLSGPDPASRNAQLRAILDHGAGRLRRLARGVRNIQEIARGLRGCPMISVRNLTKIYKLYKTPRSRLKELILRKPCHGEFAALRDVTFDLEAGETLGVIGENGAGKSTLLKILSGVLKPTRGEVHLRGRVASLLELGAGFHPEFSGMDNIFFYGSLLGLTRNKIKEKVEEVIEFSELADFIHMPVKTYSSGMQVRLAFSVAMAVEPDVLIIDEALSVGDLHFQKKSTDRILEYKRQGKSILFCSHGMYHINLLCDKVIWLKQGAIEKMGEPFDVVSAFESYQRGKDRQEEIRQSEHIRQWTPAHIESVEILSGPELRWGETLKLRISVKGAPDAEYGLAVSLRRNDHVVIHTVGSPHDTGKPFRGDREILLEYPEIPLLSGIYYFVVYLMDGNLVNLYQEVLSPEFRVQKHSIDPGLCYLPHRWVC